MKTVNIILSGLGGQGILFMTKLLAHAALGRDLNVLGAETHGMAQRGGSVVSHLKLGEARSSLVSAGTADLLLALEENEAYRCLPFLAQNARMFVNAADGAFPSKEVKPYLQNRGITYGTLAASRIALDLGLPLASNLALLGFMAASADPLFSEQELRETITAVSPKAYAADNFRVFEAGLAEGRRA